LGKRFLYSEKTRGRNVDASGLIGGNHQFTAGGTRSSSLMESWARAPEVQDLLGVTGEDLAAGVSAILVPSRSTAAHSSPVRAGVLGPHRRLRAETRLRGLRETLQAHDFKERMELIEIHRPLTYRKLPIEDALSNTGPVATSISLVGHGTVTRAARILSDGTTRGSAYLSGGHFYSAAGSRHSMRWFWPETPDRVLVGVNDNSPLSRAIGRVLCPPPGRTAQEPMPLEDHHGGGHLAENYASQIARPIGDFLRKQGLQESIYYIVTTSGVPLKIPGTNGLNGTTPPWTAN